jgi:hypothetical protein
MRAYRKNRSQRCVCIICHFCMHLRGASEAQPQYQFSLMTLAASCFICRSPLLSPFPRVFIAFRLFSSGPAPMHASIRVDPFSFYCFEFYCSSDTLPIKDCIHRMHACIHTLINLTCRHITTSQVSNLLYPKTKSIYAFAGRQASALVHSSRNSSDPTCFLG